MRRPKAYPLREAEIYGAESCTGLSVGMRRVAQWHPPIGPASWRLALLLGGRQIITNPQPAPTVAPN